MQKLRLINIFLKRRLDKLKKRESKRIRVRKLTKKNYLLMMNLGLPRKRTKLT